MPDRKKQAHMTERTRPIRRALTTLVAVLVLTVLVGSMIFVLNTARQKQQNTTTASSNTATQTPTESEGQVIYKQQLNSLATGLAWSPDSTRVASIVDGKAKSWDARTGKNVLVYSLNLDSYSPNVTWSPDGRILVFNNASKLYLVNAKTGNLLHTIDLSSVTLNSNGSSPMSVTGTAHSSKFLSTMQPLPGGISQFGQVSWSPDSKYLATSVFVKPATNQVIIWDAASGSQVKTLSNFYDAIPTVKWSPNGNWLVTVSLSGPLRSTMVLEAKLWDTHAWQVVKTYANVAPSLDWSPDGKQLALVGADIKWETSRTVRIVNALSGQATKTFSATELIQDLHWSPDGTRIALETQKAGGTKGTVTIWSMQSGKLPYTIPNDQTVYGATWSPDGKCLSTMQYLKVKVNGKDEYDLFNVIIVA